MTRYREICRDIAQRISAGELRAGDELPGVRELAASFRTTASTVSRAERQLADDGVLVLADRRRTRVALDGAVTARRFLHGESVFILAGSDDPALDLLTRALGDNLVAVAGEGSFAGLRAVRRGRADGATIHLRHHTGEDNAPFARGVLRGRQPHLIHLWRREQGLLVTPGNPLAVTGVADLAGRRTARRRHGTGTRVLVDRLLLAAGHDPDEQRGPVVGTHLEVALAVAAGIVDAGAGVRSAAADLDLDFVHLAWESYDIALGGAALGAAAPLVAALHDPALRRAVTELGGYDTTRSGQVMALDGPVGDRSPLDRAT